MSRSIVIHGGLLAVTLLGAWLTWRAADAPVAVEAEGVVLIAAAPGEVGVITWERGPVRLRLDAHEDAGGRWFSGELTEPPGAGSAGAPRRTIFRANAVAEVIWSQLEPVRATRIVADVGPDKLAELGLAEPVAALTITVGATVHRLALGGVAFGTRDTYARDAAGRVAVLPAALVGGLGPSTARLREVRVLASARQQISGLVVEAGGRRLALSQFDADRIGKAFWARAGEDAGDDRYRAWVDRLLRLQAVAYPEVSPHLADQPPALTVSVERAGRAYETLALYRLADGSWRVTSDHLRMPATVSSGLAAALAAEVPW